MKNRDKDEGTISELGNWNVADNYTKVKIMKPLALIDYYEDIARYGSESLVEDLIDYQLPPNDLIRIKGLKRLVREIIRLNKNAKFACKKKGTKEKVLEYQKIVKKLETVLPTLIQVDSDNIKGTRSISIKDNNLFEDFIEKISDIASRLNEPLNQNHLIFTDKEEFDPIAFKELKKHQMINKG